MDRVAMHTVDCILIKFNKRKREEKKKTFVGTCQWSENK